MQLALQHQDAAHRVKVAFTGAVREDVNHMISHTARNVAGNSNTKTVDKQIKGTPNTVIKLQLRPRKGLGPRPD